MSAKGRHTKWTPDKAWEKRSVGKHYYAFEWKGGGYNTLRANDLKEAIAKATAMGAGTRNRLKPDIKSFRQDADAREIEQKWYMG